MERSLQPNPRLWLRAVLFAVLLTPLLLSSVGWFQKLFVVAMLALMVGTFRRSWIRGDKFRTGMVVMFYPMRMRQWKLERFVVIEIELENRLHFLWVLATGPMLWLVCRISDFLFPWIGGEFTLWLRTAKGKRVLAWQGNSEDHFETNLELLQNATGAEIQRKGR